MLTQPRPDQATPETAVRSGPTVLTSEDATCLRAFAAHPLESRRSEGRRVGLVILPDACGLAQAYEQQTLRFAGQGFDVVAIDYYGRTAGTADRADDFRWPEHFTRVRSADIALDVASAVAYLRSPEGGDATSVFALGFGFGGAQSWLQAANGLGLTGAIGFAGRPNPTNREGEPAPVERVQEFTCPILGLAGWLDSGANPGWSIAFERALAAAGVPHELAVYRRTGRSFFDLYSEQYPDAASDAWQRILRFVDLVSQGATDRLTPYVIVGKEPTFGPTTPAVSVPSVSYSEAGRPFPPREAVGGWPVLTDRREIAARGLDPDRLVDLAEWAATVQYPPPLPPSPWGLLVIKDGLVVTEAYDRPSTRYRPQAIASIGKSISPCAFGQWLEASRRGELGLRLDLDSPVYDRRYLPEGFPLSDPRKEAISFRHVLTHTSGIRPEWDFCGGMGYNFVEYTLGKSVPYPDSARLVFDPGKGYGYSSVAFNHFSIVAPHVTGRYLHDQVRADIFGPIGAESAIWRWPDGDHFAYEDTEGRYQRGAGGPHLTARDLARYAYLHLRKGQWAGRGVVPEWYMGLARQVVLLNDSQRTDYGLGFLSNARLGMSADLPQEAFGLGGAGLNFAAIVPNHDLIVVHTSRIYAVLDHAAVAKGFYRRVAGLLR